MVKYPVVAATSFIIWNFKSAQQVRQILAALASMS